MELKRLKEAKQELKTDVRKDRIRNVTRAGVLSNFRAANGFLVDSINELWDLVCDVANRRIDEAIKTEANRMIDEANSELK